MHEGRQAVEERGWAQGCVSGDGEGKGEAGVCCRCRYCYWYEEERGGGERREGTDGMGVEGVESGWGVERERMGEGERVE